MYSAQWSGPGCPVARGSPHMYSCHRKHRKIKLKKTPPPPSWTPCCILLRTLLGSNDDDMSGHHAMIQYASQQHCCISTNSCMSVLPALRIGRSSEGPSGFPHLRSPLPGTAGLLKLQEGAVIGEESCRPRLTLVFGRDTANRSVISGHHPTSKNGLVFVGWPSQCYSKSNRRHHRQSQPAPFKRAGRLGGAWLSAANRYVGIAPCNNI
ncbi:hypothetical protein B0T24DRAFT_171452 [Lasiosphaeria ovina]|uniref:Uncharacterized protein n=1 Tax=Lasiosphaeria ovina TaxID=92902 RepID=A0AAE0NE44_9PEZI|nr:hypothetical protein B0T24DRAFT_171452 [Lasiosphaeria ovina]